MKRICAALAVLLAPAGAQPHWSKGWHDAFHHAGSQAVHVAVMSDSTAHVDQTNGIGSGPDKRENLWPNQLQRALSSIVAGGSHGTGLLTLEANAARYDTDVWQIAGPYSYNPEIGPFQPERTTKGGHLPANGATVRLSAGVEAALASQDGDALWLYWASCPDSGPFTVYVDNIAQGQFGAERSSVCVPKRTRVYTGPLGPHTARIKAGTASTYLYAAEWTVGTGGAAVDNLAVGGATTIFYAAPSKLSYLRTIPNLGLVIVALGINDYAHALPLDAYAANLTTVIDETHKIAPAASILVVSQYPVLSDNRKNSLGLPQADYSAAAQQVASRLHVGYLSFPHLWGSVQDIEKQGWLTSDLVHPSDKGGQQISQEILKFITEDQGLR